MRSGAIVPAQSDFRTDVGDMNVAHVNPRLPGVLGNADRSTHHRVWAGAGSIVKLIVRSSPGSPSGFATALSTLR